MTRRRRQPAALADPFDRSVVPRVFIAEKTTPPERAPSSTRKRPPSPMGKKADRRGHQTDCQWLCPVSVGDYEWTRGDYPGHSCSFLASYSVCLPMEGLVPTSIRLASPGPWEKRHAH